MLPEYLAEALHKSVPFLVDMRSGQPFKQLLSLYDGISKEQLRENMRYFLSAIMSVREECGMNMCVHPDDPPFPVLGLPRIVTSSEDIDWFLGAVDNPHNGLTFCAGSLSAGAQNNVGSSAKPCVWSIKL